MSRADLTSLGVALTGTAVVAWWFSLHPQPLLLGVMPQPTLVPWWYQAAAFPPFLLLATGALLERRALGPRVGLLAGASLVAVVRLAGLIPLSGHATFLAACVVFTWGGAPIPRSRWVLATALVALGLTTAYKMLWGDEWYFLLSVAAGAALGLACRRRLLRQAEQP